MEFRVSRDKFSRSIQIVQGIAQPSLSSPILENVVIAATGDSQISLRTSNLSLTVLSEIEGVVIEPGEVAVPMKDLAQIGKELPQAEIEVLLDGNILKINCGPAVLRLRGVEADEFPRIGRLDSGTEFEMQTLDLIKMIEKTVFATSTEKARYTLEGIKVDVEGSRVKFVATDGKRLSLVEKALATEVESAISVLIPGRTMAEVRRIAQDEGSLRIKVGEKKIEFSGSDFFLSSNLLVDNFPPYRQLIPSEFNLFFETGTEGLIQAVRRASVLTDERTKMIELIISNEGIQVTGLSQAHGEAKTTLEVEYDGELFRTAFRSDFFLDVLRVIEGEKIRAEFKSPTSPAVMKDSKDNGFLHVLMPIKLEEIAPRVDLDDDDDDDNDGDDDDDK